MATSTELEEALGNFARRVTGLELGSIRRFSIGEIRGQKLSAFGEWGRHAGIYFFEQHGEVKYVGRALPGTGLWARVRNQCTSFGDSRWDRVIEDEETIVGVVVVPPQEWYWTAALEPFLIQRCAPEFNRRAC